VSRFINTNVKTELSSSCTPFQREAAYIAQRIPRARVLVIGGPPVPALILRVRCFEAAARARGLQILDKQDNTSDVAGPAQRIAADMLTKHPDTQAIWAYNDPTALGAAAAVRGAGKAVWSGSREGIIVVGNNADRDAIAAIRARALTLTYDENTFEAGVAAIRALRPVLAGGRPVRAMPKQLLIKATMYDLSNVGRWVPPNRRPVRLR
jgi:ribose transport system substrate-binding protein